VFLCVDESARHCGKANQNSSITMWHKPEYSRSSTKSGARISIIRRRTKGPELMGPRAASLKLRRKFRKRSGLVSSGLETS
jgi:hypothetical protein